MADTPPDQPDRGQRPLSEAHVESARQTGRHEPQGGEAAGGERVGPVAIARHVKDDGRALILYARDRGRR